MYIKTFATACPSTPPPSRYTRVTSAGSPSDPSAARKPTAPAPAHHPRPWPRRAGLVEATATAREMTLKTLELTLRPLHHDPGDESLELAAALRCATAGIALGLEARTAHSLLSALHSLWRASDLIDRAEQAGLLEIDEAVELLVLGSRVEVPLVSFLRRCGLERVLKPGMEAGWPPLAEPGSAS